MRSNYKKLGTYIREASGRNGNLQVNNLLGVSITKEFIPSIANTIGTDMTTYKVVRLGQFAYGPVTSRNGDKISVALLKGNDCIISQAYTVFEIIDHDKLDPEYLMMWFRRPEFDRYARFMSHGSVRELFGWAEMCSVELPVPTIEKQRKIVREYNVVVNRINLNERMNQKLEETAQAIYKQWFVDFEFPITKEYAASIGKPELEGKPYKSSGGEMVICKELDKEIPKGWMLSKLSKLYEFQYGKGNNNPDNGGKYPVYGSNGIIGGYDEYNNEDAPVIGHIGANCGSLVYAPGKHYVTYNGVMCNIKSDYNRYFGYSTLLASDLQSQTRGSSQPFVSYDMLYDISFIDPDKATSDIFSKKAQAIFEQKSGSQKILQSLNHMKEILLSRMAVIDNGDGRLVA